MPKRKRVSKSGPIWHKSAEEATLDKMPKFNAHACGTGPHGDLKYNRAKQKRNGQREFDQREARNCGPRPYMRDVSKESKEYPFWALLDEGRQRRERLVLAKHVVGYMTARRLLGICRTSIAPIACDL